MQETDLHHLIVEHHIIVFVVCTVLMMTALTIIGVNLMNYLDKRRDEKLKKKGGKRVDFTNNN